MSRTTLDIDDPILLELKKLQQKEGKSLGQTVSELLAEALSFRRSGKRREPHLRWIAKPMKELVDITDKEALWAALDQDDRSKA